MNVASMVEEVARAVSATVSRSIAPIQRQIDELIAWRNAIGEIRNGVDGAKGEPGIAGKDGAPGANGKDAPPVDLEQVVAKVLALVPKPKDGVRGADGRDGRDGVDGAKGDPGADGKDGAPGQKGDPGVAGKDGQNGAPGERGNDGSNGRDGKDGIGIKRFDYDEKAHTLDIVLDNGEVSPLRLPVPQRGERGEPGLAGKDGAQGPRGEKGDIASPEDIAAAVTKACEALLPAMVAKQYETSMPEIIARASVLVPAGRDGLPGRPGSPGEDGKDGASFDGIEFQRVDRRTHVCVLKMSNGSRYEWPIKLDGMVLDSDVHRPGESYEKGDAVTHGGSYWIARKDTRETPGKSDDWRLAVKRGRDGKDASGAEE